MLCMSNNEKIKLQRTEATTDIYESKQSYVTSLVINIFVVTFKRGKYDCPGQVSHAACTV